MQNWFLSAAAIPLFYLIQLPPEPAPTPVPEQTYQVAAVGNLICPECARTVRPRRRQVVVVPAEPTKVEVSEEPAEELKSQQQCRGVVIIERPVYAVRTVFGSRRVRANTSCRGVTAATVVRATCASKSSCASARVRCSGRQPLRKLARASIRVPVRTINAIARIPRRITRGGCH